MERDTHCDNILYKGYNINQIFLGNYLSNYSLGNYFVIKFKKCKMVFKFKEYRRISNKKVKFPGIRYILQTF